MNEQKGNKALIGAGVAACAVCCAGPILAVLAAIGVSTAVGYVLFGAGAVLVGAGIAAFVLLRRRRRAHTSQTAMARASRIVLSVAEARSVSEV